MRVAIICLASALALTVGCSKKPAPTSVASGSSAAESTQPAASAGRIMTPHRKSGLWEVAMNTSGGPGVRMTSQMCVDAATDKDITWHGPRSQGKNCSKTEMRPGLGGLTFDSVCKAGARTITSHGVIKGDFNKSYDVDVTTHIDPAPPGLNSDMKVSMQARWVGPCPAGLKPGQMKMEMGGVHIGR